MRQHHTFGDSRGTGGVQDISEVVCLAWPEVPIDGLMRQRGFPIDQARGRIDRSLAGAWAGQYHSFGACRQIRTAAIHKQRTHLAVQKNGLDARSTGPVQSTGT